MLRCAADQLGEQASQRPLGRMEYDLGGQSQPMLAGLELCGVGGGDQLMGLSAGTS
ncbi:hypothetical protein [Actinacidiphila glaucinigra]|nr:hypothetical protein [Actinacidiphila glaucinigra]